MCCQFTESKSLEMGLVSVYEAKAPVLPVSLGLRTDASGIETCF